MDKLDFLILSELLKDASLSFVQIAKNIGTSPYTVRRRFEKMKKDGLILKCIVTIDLTKLGYQGKAFLLITVEPNSNKSDTINYLTKLKNVIVATEIIGPYDILAITPIMDLNSIQEIVQEARKAPNIKRIEIACIDDINFPVSPNMGAILSQKSVSLSTK
jgi:Lrp/AsnC family transcriptional regulator, regulator for asnA, asnC and gidA